MPILLDVFVIPHPNQNTSVSLLLIHAEPHALASERANAAIHVLSNVIPVLVRHVKSPLAQNVTAP